MVGMVELATEQRRPSRALCLIIRKLLPSGRIDDLESDIEMLNATEHLPSIPGRRDIDVVLRKELHPSEKRTRRDTGVVMCSTVNALHSQHAEVLEKDNCVRFEDRTLRATWTGYGTVRAGRSPALMRRTAEKQEGGRRDEIGTS